MSGCIKGFFFSETERERHGAAVVESANKIQERIIYQTKLIQKAGKQNHAAFQEILKQFSRESRDDLKAFRTQERLEIGRAHV